MVRLEKVVIEVGSDEGILSLRDTVDGQYGIIIGREQAEFLASKSPAGRAAPRPLPPDTYEFPTVDEGPECLPPEEGPGASVAVVSADASLFIDNFRALMAELGPHGADDALEVAKIVRDLMTRR